MDLYPFVIMCFWVYGPSLWFLGHRPSIYTCLVCFSVRICPKRTWGMIFMILSPVGGSRTLCILLLYTMSIYKGKRFDETGILDIKCHTKKTENGQFLHKQVLMPSATHLRLFPLRWDHLLCKKQTNKNNNNIIINNNNNNLDSHLSKKKGSSWRNFQRVQWRRTFQGGLLYQFWGPPTLHQRKAKVHSNTSGLQHQV